MSHFKRDADKALVYSLSGEKNQLENLLIASTAIHTYDYLGIRTRSGEEHPTSVEASRIHELTEKKDLYHEISQLLTRAIEFEIELANFTLDYERQILDAMLKQTDLSDQTFVQSFKDRIEENMIQALNKYPTVYFYDHIGELTGYTIQTKTKILDAMAGLKPTSVDLEIELVREKNQDLYIELTTLSQMIQRMCKDFEFKSIKELRTDTYSLRKIISQILNYRFNYYPISQRRLEIFRKATEFKAQIYQRFRDANQKTIEYNQFEANIIDFIIAQLKAEAKVSPYHFVYFLENILDFSFEDTFDILNRYGLFDLVTFSELQQIDLSAFMYDCNTFQIDKMDFVSLNKSQNPITDVEMKLNELKQKKICNTQKSLEELLKDPQPQDVSCIKDACRLANISYEDLLKFYQKKRIIEYSFQKKYPQKWLNGYIMLFDLGAIFQNLGRFIYFIFFAKICRQAARVLETFIKLKEDKAVILLGLKRITSDDNPDMWVTVKIEELIIERLMQRQGELATVFNAENQAFKVNTFILARFMDWTESAATQSLTKENSLVYEDVANIPLPQDMISPVSYVIALDLLKRMKNQYELKQIKREKFVESQVQVQVQKRQEVKKAQDLNTLNFIEKKITSTIMVAKTGAMNPTALYWSEKDQKLTMDNIKNHSDLQNRQICRMCGKDVTDSMCVEHPTAQTKANALDLFTQFYNFALIRIKELWPKMKLPSFSELRMEVMGWMNEAMQRRLRRPFEEKDTFQLIEGERTEIASKIATAIGENLDKVLYKRFKDAM